MAARETSTSTRERWYEERLNGAKTPQEEFHILSSRLAADVKRLPEELHYGVYEVAVSALRDVLSEVSEVMVDFGSAKRTARA